MISILIEINSLSIFTLLMVDITYNDRNDNEG